MQQRMIHLHQKILRGQAQQNGQVQAEQAPSHAQPLLGLAVGRT